MITPEGTQVVVCSYLSNEPKKGEHLLAPSQNERKFVWTQTRSRKLSIEGASSGWANHADSHFGESSSLSVLALVEGI